MQRKTLLGTFLLTSILYYIVPLLFLKFYNGTSDKAGFILILAYTIGNIFYTKNNLYSASKYYSSTSTVFHF